MSILNTEHTNSILNAMLVWQLNEMQIFLFFTKLRSFFFEDTRNELKQIAIRVTLLFQVKIYELYDSSVISS